MRTRLQYIEPIEQYYKRLWNISEAAVRDFVRMYNSNKNIWKYDSFAKWLKDCYKFEISYKQFMRFEKYCDSYVRRKNLKLSKKVKVNW